MQITRDLRVEAAQLAERDKGMADKSKEFIAKGADIYIRETTN
jgi:phosphomethylpyrimidine synthase